LAVTALIFAGTGFIGGQRVEVAGRLVGATGDFIGVANAISVGVGFARSSTNPERIELVALTIALALGDARAPADSAFIGLKAVPIGWVIVIAGGQIGAVVEVVTKCVCIDIDSAVSSANAQRIDEQARRAICSIWLIVAGGRVCTSGNFQLITDAVTIGVVAGVKGITDSITICIG